MAERNIKLTIAYDGTAYHGWQQQPGGIVTVQETMKMALARVVQHPVTLWGASRTDAGVHAAGQVANFRSGTPIPAERLSHAINTRLPMDIRVRSAQDVPDNFDAITSCRGKLYRYIVFHPEDMPPGEERLCYHFWRPCDVVAMQRAAQILVGEHDFASFASTGHQRENTVRTVLRCDVWRQFHYTYFEVEGTGFLYHMVRNIVGTLLEIGRGHWPVEKMPEILAARDRAAAGPMVPPQGLCLMWVKY